MGFHHFYIGMFLILVSFILRIKRWGQRVVVIVLFLLGYIISVDDFYQHIRQQIEPEYHSPLHRLYGEVYSRSKLIRKLNKAADKVFGLEYDE